MAETISVVIPVLNEGPFIARTLDGLLDQDYPRQSYDIYVVDGGSTDGTRETVQGYATRCPQVHLLDNPRGLASAGRNLGIRASQGDLVVVVDGHCQVSDRGYLSHLVDAFHRSKADCVGRPQPLDVAGATTLQRAIAVARASSLGHHPDSYVYTGREHFVPAQSVGVAYRRSVFRRIGYFDESFDACEDVEFNHRLDVAGLRCFLTPAIQLRYYPRTSLRGLFRQLSRYGRGRMRLCRKHPGTFTLKSFLPALFVLLLATLAAMGMLWRPAALCFWTLLLAYGLAIVLYSGYLARRRGDWHLLPWLPIVFITVHFGAALGALREFFLGWRTRVPLIGVTPLFTPGRSQPGS
jgi:succinoglycan biosynthesis protein ExoA